MRHLRAMRSTTPTPADSFPLGLGGTLNDPHNNTQGRFSSPRPSVSRDDPGDTPTSSASLGDGSSSPLPLGQLTPPSLPPQEEDWEVEAGGVASEGAPAAAGADDDAAASFQVFIAVFAVFRFGKVFLP